MSLLLLPNEILREILAQLISTDLATLFAMRRVCKPLKSAVDTLLYSSADAQMPSKQVLSEFTPSALIDSFKEQAEFSWPKTLERQAFIQRAMNLSKSKELVFGIFDAEEESCHSYDSIKDISLNGDSLFLSAGHKLYWLGLNPGGHEILHNFDTTSTPKILHYTNISIMQNPRGTFVHHNQDKDGFNKKHYRLNYNGYVGIVNEQLKFLDLTSVNPMMTNLPIDLPAETGPVDVEYAGPGKCLLELKCRDPYGGGDPLDDICRLYLMGYIPGNYSLLECSYCAGENKFDIDPETKKLEIVDLYQPELEGKLTKSIIYISPQPVIPTSNGEPLQPDKLPRQTEDYKCADPDNLEDTDPDQLEDFYYSNGCIIYPQPDLCSSDSSFSQMYITQDQKHFKLYNMPGDIEATTLHICYGQVLFLGTVCHGILGYKFRDLMNLDLENPDFTYDQCKDEVKDIKVAYYKERLTIAFSTRTKVYYGIMDKDWLMS